MPLRAVVGDHLVVAGEIEDATKGQKYLCPGCRAPMYRRTSNRGLAHFVHFRMPSVQSCGYKSGMGAWHERYSHALRLEYAEVKRSPHILDAYDARSQRGVEFQHSPILQEAVMSRNATTPGLAWVLDCTATTTVYEHHGRHLMDLPTRTRTFWTLVQSTPPGNVWVDLGGGAYFHILDSKYHAVWDVQRCRVRRMWVGSYMTCPMEMLQATGLRAMLQEPSGADLCGEETVPALESIDMQPYCTPSALFWDQHERQQFTSAVFPQGSTVGLVAPAGAGKTHETIQWCNRQPDQSRVLYLVFNKHMEEEAQRRLHAEAEFLSSVRCQTIDAFLLSRWKGVYPRGQFELQLTPSLLVQLLQYVPAKGGYAWKMAVCTAFDEFCLFSEAAHVPELKASIPLTPL